MSPDPGLHHRAGPLRAVVVAVPAHDEADHIGACLRSLDRAAAAVPLPVTVVLGADGCRDGTVEIARALPLRHARLVVVENRWRIVGAVRAAAVGAGLAATPQPASAVWIANTDADCVVGRDWLSRQVLAAELGTHAVAGLVTLDAESAHISLRGAFVATYASRGAGDHSHVHGANLGVRADAYLSVGGWNTHTMVGEEHRLWRRLGAAGFERATPTDLVVTTSGRTASRVKGGFASRLRRLERATAHEALTA